MRGCLWLSCSILFGAAPLSFCTRVEVNQLVAVSLGLDQYQLVSRLDPPTSPEGLQFVSLDGSQPHPLGKGAYGEVWLAASEDGLVAVKFFFSYALDENGVLVPDPQKNCRYPHLDPQNCYKQVAINEGNKADVHVLKGEDRLRKAHEECELLKSINTSLPNNLRQPNHIARCLKDGTNDPNHAYLVFEYAGSEHLEAYAARTTRTPQQRQIGLHKLARMILEGLVQLQGAGFVHRDLKGLNIVVGGNDDNPQLHFVDFGSAVTAPFTSKIKHAGLTEAYMPPETMGGSKQEIENNAWCITDENFTFTSKYDVYSAGETLFSLLCGGRDFNTMRTLVYRERKRQTPRRDAFGRGLHRDLSWVKPENWGSRGPKDRGNFLACGQAEGKNLVFPLIANMLSRELYRKSATKLLEALDAIENELDDSLANGLHNGLCIIVTTLIIRKADETDPPCKNPEIHIPNRPETAAKWGTLGMDI